MRFLESLIDGSKCLFTLKLGANVMGEVVRAFRRRRQLSNSASRLLLSIVLWPRLYLAYLLPLHNSYRRSCST
jgi:hypothetical protein